MPERNYTVGSILQDTANNIRSKLGYSSKQDFPIKVKDIGKLILNLPEQEEPVDFDLADFLAGNFSSIAMDLPYIRPYAFADCSQLVQASFSTCTEIGMAGFENCSALQEAYFQKYPH